jgi:phosphotransferase system  glucose/maltose/N-acetylglucosamine-specific IIC component
MPFIGLIVAGSPAIVGFFGLLFAIAMLLGFRSAWYLSLVYWTVLGIFSSVILSTMLVNADWSASSNWYMLLIPFAPLLFSVVSFMYFRTGEVKDYFGMP